MQDSKGKEKLSGMLLVCFDALRTYGKEPEALENIIALHQMVLADYPIAAIETALRFYMKHNNEMPTPADLVHIIERGGNKPPLERAVYVQASKKHPEDRSSAEWDYIREYERFAQTGKL